MTGNVAQVFLTDDEWSATLQAIGTALRSEGYLVFETRRPERRAWEEWAADTGRQLRDVPGVGRAEERRLMILMPTFSYGPTSASRSPEASNWASISRRTMARLSASPTPSSCIRRVN
jgi:hypothetical protein